MNICEDGYSGNHDPFFQEISDDCDEIQMIPDTLDDGSVVVNFDVYDKENNEVIKTGGYVLIRKEEDLKDFYICVFNKDGDQMSQTRLPFDWLSLDQCSNPDAQLGIGIAIGVIITARRLVWIFKEI